MDPNKMQSTSSSLQMQIDSRLENIALIGVASRALALHAGLTPEESFAVELCVVEAVTNSIEHGYQCEAGHNVRVGVRLTQNRLEFEIRDHGRGTLQNLENSPTPGLIEAEASHQHLPTRGRGTFLINELMNRAVYNTASQGLTLTMSKNLN